MKPKLKNYPVSDVELGAFLLDCAKLYNACKKFSKEVAEMTKQTCAICNTRHEEVWTCDSCGKRCCADHITCQKMAEDDFMHLCTDCLEKD